MASRASLVGTNLCTEDASRRGEPPIGWSPSQVRAELRMGGPRSLARIWKQSQAGWAIVGACIGGRAESGYWQVRVRPKL